MRTNIEFVYPSFPEEKRNEIFDDQNVFIVVAVFGKSSLPHCNKMEAFEVMDEAVSLSPNADPRACYNGRIIFYVDKVEKILYLHFETTFDDFIMEKALQELSEIDPEMDFFQMNTVLNCRFAQLFLLAVHVSHIIVFVDPGNTFDASCLPLFRSINIAREKLLPKILSKRLKNQEVAAIMGKEFRLCSPRIVFYFDKPVNADQTDEDRYEIELENEIYALLKHENVLFRNSSLFSIPKKMPFVQVNRERNKSRDPVQETINDLADFLTSFSREVREGSEDIDDSMRPCLGFGKSLNLYDKTTLDREFEDLKKRDSIMKKSLPDLIKKHVKDALASGCENNPRFRAKSSHFITPTANAWLEIFNLFYEIFEINPVPTGLTSDEMPTRLTFLKSLEKFIDVDVGFFRECCDEGLKVAVNRYEMNLRSHYSQSYHDQKLNQSYGVYLEYARGGKTLSNGEKLKEICDGIWRNNRQLCECLSLRGNPCIMPKHNHSSPLEHSSGVVFVSTCNCGRTQNRREDPYLVKQANYDFYQLINCAHCVKADKIHFPIFEPSINDFSAANVSMSPEKIKYDDVENKIESNTTTPLTQQSHSNLSYESFMEGEAAHSERKRKQRMETEEELIEIVVKVGAMKMEADKARHLALTEAFLRQPSTTEYLPGMVTTSSPPGLLPQFPSWSLMCIGKSLLYSHNTGLLEHFQNKFLSGANFLLPWNVHVRLEHASNWTANYERCKNRKKQINANPNVFQLKIFIGFEYECPRGHRFFMSSPDKILQSTDLTASKNEGSKVAYNDMPFYFPCRCQNTLIAQLMRVHVVTPKAPVNVKLDPKIRIGNRTTNPLVFLTGLSEPKLTQSDYWILRLPYVYQTEEGPILPPQEVDPSNAVVHGCLLAGSFGIIESEENFDL